MEMTWYCSENPPQPQNAYITSNNIVQNCCVCYACQLSNLSDWVLMLSQVYGDGWTDWGAHDALHRLDDLVAHFFGSRIRGVRLQSGICFILYSYKVTILFSYLILPLFECDVWRPVVVVEAWRGAEHDWHEHDAVDGHPDPQQGVAQVRADLAQHLGSMSWIYRHHYVGKQSVANWFEGKVDGTKLISLYTVGPTALERRQQQAWYATYYW